MADNTYNTMLALTRRYHAASDWHTRDAIWEIADTLQAGQVSPVGAMRLARYVFRMPARSLSYNVA